ncbi:MAG: alkyl hydroperoxide reductase [Kordiimonadales bacterium]|nr:MAG: alkyl hydroperoxide reductase [Kordiimonadales bacterium]
MNLTKTLAEMITGSAKRIPPETLQVMNKAISDLAATGIVGAALATGVKAPDFTLKSANGGMVSLSGSLAKGPVVLVFYRGAWCPYCNIELRAYQEALSRINELGATLVAVSPQTADNSLTSKEKNELTFDVLSDAGFAVSDAYGLTFELPDSLVEVYKKFGISLVESNGADDWRLPIAATFVIAQDGTVVLDSVDVDYKVRLDPEEVIACLEKLRG